MSPATSITAATVLAVALAAFPVAIDRDTGMPGAKLSVAQEAAEEDHPDDDADHDEDHDEATDGDHPDDDADHDEATDGDHPDDDADHPPDAPDDPPPDEPPEDEPPPDDQQLQRIAVAIVAAIRRYGQQLRQRPEHRADGGNSDGA